MDKPAAGNGAPKESLHVMSAARGESVANPVVDAHDVSFSYPDHPVLSSVGFSMSMSPGHRRLGVVGENGTGKSTLLQLITGQLTPGRGSVATRGLVSWVSQEMSAPPEATVGDLIESSMARHRTVLEQLCFAAENMDGFENDAEYPQLLAEAERIDAWDARRRIEEALTELASSRDFGRPLALLSVGEQYRVRLACVLGERADILLLDEPTNHLDDTSLAFLTQTLQRWPGLVAFVTHDRQLLDDVAERIIDLDPSPDGTPVLYRAMSYEEYREHKGRAWQRWSQAYARQQKRFERLLETRDSAYEALSDAWVPPKGSQKHRRATRARQHVKNADRLSEQTAAETPPMPPPPLRFRVPELSSGAEFVEPGQPLIELQDVVSEGRLNLRGVSVAIAPGGRLLVTGGNGSGTSTVLSMIGGELQPHSGRVTRADGIRIGYLPQQPRSDVDVEETPFVALTGLVSRLLHAGAMDPDHVVPIALVNVLNEEDLARPLRELSVGQRRRFDLACCFVAAPHVLVLDEPTNHLSVTLMDELTRSLQVTPAAVVVASHDRRMRADFAHWPTLTLDHGCTPVNAVVTGQ